MPKRGKTDSKKPRRKRSKMTRKKQKKFRRKQTRRKLKHQKGAGLFTFLTGKKKPQNIDNAQPTEKKKGGMFGFMEDFLDKRRQQFDAGEKTMRNQMKSFANNAQSLVVNKNDLTYDFIEKALTKYFKEDKQKAMDAVAFIKLQKKEEKEGKEEKKDQEKLKDVTEGIKVKDSGERKDSGDKKDSGEKKDSDKKGDDAEITEIEISLSGDEK